MRLALIGACWLSGCYAAHEPLGPREYALVEKIELGGPFLYSATDAGGALRAGPAPVRFVFDEGWLVAYDERSDALEPAAWIVVPIEEHVGVEGDGCVPADPACVVLEEQPGPRWYERSLARVDWAIVHVDPARFGLPDEARPIELPLAERVDPMLDGERDASAHLRTFHLPARYACGAGCERALNHRFEAR